MGSEKPIASVNIDVEGKKLLVRRFGLKATKNSTVIGFQENFVPRSFLPDFFISQKESSPNVPHKFEVFDDRAIKFLQGEWIYLGINRRAKKFIHQYEVRGDLRLLVTLSENRKLLSVEDYLTGITYKRDLL